MKRAGLGLQFLQAIELAVQRIDAIPSQGTAVGVVRGRSIRKILVRGFPYRIFYADSDPCIVLTIHHQHRDAADLQGRLRD